MMYGSNYSNYMYEKSHVFHISIPITCIFTILFLDFELVFGGLEFSAPKNIQKNQDPPAVPGDGPSTKAQTGESGGG